MHPILIKFLKVKKKEFGFNGRILTLGKQKVLLDRDQYFRFFRKNIQKLEVDDVDLFRELGGDNIESLDYYGTKGATILHDLNKNFHICKDFVLYDLVIDGGTLEHCFNVGVYMETVLRLVKVGGRVLHISPCQGYANHGFFNFQPTFFFDFYGENGWGDMHCYLFEHLDHDYYNEMCQVNIKKIQNDSRDFCTSNNSLILFSSKKIKDNEDVVFPIQSIYK